MRGRWRLSVGEDCRSGASSGAARHTGFTTCTGTSSNENVKERGSGSVSVCMGVQAGVTAGSCGILGCAKSLEAASNMSTATCMCTSAIPIGDLDGSVSESLSTRVTNSVKTGVSAGAGIVVGCNLKYAATTDMRTVTGVSTSVNAYGSLGESVTANLSVPEEVLGPCGCEYLRACSCTCCCEY